MTMRTYGGAQAQEAVNEAEFAKLALGVDVDFQALFLGSDGSDGSDRESSSERAGREDAARGRHDESDHEGSARGAGRASGTRR
ncbi:hypothetical protein [Streptomyces boncukensis]|uniref:Uncharacterized protein n=1 Tax=Streptomyces boncukensis TaxID=2711219 RepID=A0A6G4WYG3_9ACTN|nr:hypothetical protein [Streptomyces boncukensis]NGO70275.1 hypothetical protein [Streptomyces boncukensis]